MWQETCLKPALHGETVPIPEREDNGSITPTFHCGILSINNLTYELSEGDSCNYTLFTSERLNVVMLAEKLHDFIKDAYSLLGRIKVRNEISTRKKHIQVFTT